MIEAYLIHILVLIGIYAILAVSLNLAIGYTGLLNLGHVAFFGIGAYTSALLARAGVPFIICLLAAGILAGIAGFVMLLVTRRLKGDYLALATLGLSFVVYSILINWTSVTRGALGISGISFPTLFGITITTNLGYLTLTLLIGALSIGIITLIVRSPFGRLLEATRDDAVGLRMLGKNTFALKAKAMTISAFFAGIAGSLYAHYIHFIDPGSFYIAEILLIVTIVIVGGLASIKGSIIGAIVILAIPEVLRFLMLPSSIVGPARQIVYGIVLLLVLLFRPRGIFGKVDLA